MVGVKHHTQTTKPDDPAYDVSKDEWNEAHDPGACADVLTDHDKTLHDGLAINADQVDGVDLPATIVEVLTDHDKTAHGSTVVDHGSIDGLGDDDHSQYIKVDGTRAFTDNQSMGGNKLTTIATPISGSDASTKDYVDGKIQGLDWQESVLDNDLTSPPPTPNAGDRYIIAPGATGDWAGHDNEITEWDGSAWIFFPLDEGVACRVEDEDLTYTWNGVAWVNFGSTIDHGGLLGLADDDHTQYLNTTRHDTTDRHSLGIVVPHDALASLTEKSHASLTSVTSDQHHAESHSLASHTGSGTVKTTLSFAVIEGSDGLLGGGSSDHNILSSTHLDAIVASVLRGDLVIGNATPAWGKLVIGLANRVLKSDGTDPLWGQVDHTELTGVTADQHHTQTHTLTSHSTKAHSELTDVLADQHPDTKVRTKVVDESAIGDGKTLVYRTASDTLVYEAPAGGGESENVVVATADTANATTTLANANGLSFSVLANSTYIIEGFICWTTSAITVGIKLSATAPTTPTLMAGHFIMDAANGTPDSSSFNANDVVITTSASAFTAGNIAALHCVLKTGANAGTFQIRFAAETTGTITIKIGSTLRYRKVA